MDKSKRHKIGNILKSGKMFSRQIDVYKIQSKRFFCKILYCQKVAYKSIWREKGSQRIGLSVWDYYNFKEICSFSIKE